jgi:hypothetical protein
MSDPSAAVRDTAAWFVGRVCDIVPEAVLNPNIFEHVLGAMVNGLGDEPRVAQNICWAFSSLSDAAYDHAQNQLGTEDTPTTYCMSRVRKYALFLDFINFFLSSSLVASSRNFWSRRTDRTETRRT